MGAIFVFVGKYICKLARVAGNIRIIIGFQQCKYFRNALFYVSALYVGCRAFTQKVPAVLYYVVYRKINKTNIRLLRLSGKGAAKMVDGGIFLVVIFVRKSAVKNIVAVRAEEISLAHVKTAFFKAYKEAFVYRRYQWGENFL